MTQDEKLIKRKRNTLIPSKVCDRTKRFMRDLLEVLDQNNVHSVLDKPAIQLLAYTYDNYIKATEMIEQSDIVVYHYTSTGKNLKAHPAVKIQLDAQVQLTKLLIEFGLTPKSRKDIDSAKVQPDASPLELFIQKHKDTA